MTPSYSYAAMAAMLITEITGITVDLSVIFED